MSKSDPKYLLASAYITTFRSLGCNSEEAHNPKHSGTIHYFIKKKLNIDIIEHMIEIIDRMYSGSLEEDLEIKNIDEEDVFDELDKQNNESLLNLFRDIAEKKKKEEYVIV